MKKCCDSCRYFQKRSDLAGQGWCRHPQRVDTTSDLVLVRGTQLDCRKEWDQNLWEPNSSDQLAPVRHDRGRSLGPVPPATPAEIAWILRSTRGGEIGSGRAGGMGEDRVVGAEPSPIRNVPKVLLKHPPSTPVDSGDAEEDEKNPGKRVTMLRAREVQRARATNRMHPSADPLPSSESTRGATPSRSDSDDKTDTGAAPPLASATPSTPARVEVDETDSMPTVLPADAIVIPVAPPVTIQGSPSNEILTATDRWRSAVSTLVERDSMPPTLRLIRGKKTWTPEEVEVEPTIVQPEVEIDRVVVTNNTNTHDRDVVVETADPGEAIRPERTRIGRKPARKPRGTSFSFQNRWVDARREPSPELSAPLSPAIERPLSTISPDARVDRFGEGVTERVEEPEILAFGSLPNLDDHAALSALAPSTPTDIERRRYDDVPVDREPKQYAAMSDWAPPALLDSVDQDDVVVGNDALWPIVLDPLIDDEAIHSDIPRMCKTCSAFRTGDNPERGWCSNGWAFDNRTFVNPTSVPCASSIGDWWLPSDAFWDDGLLDRLGSPAPLYDREFAAQLAPPRQRVVPRRSRRR